MSGARLPSGALDPADPKNSFVILHEKRMTQDRVQDKRIARAYREGQLKPDKKIPGLLNHNNALPMATAASRGWTYAERWRPSEHDERERLRRARHGEATAIRDAVGEEKTLEEDLREGGSPEVVHEEERKGTTKSAGRRISTVLFGSRGCIIRSPSN